MSPASPTPQRILAIFGTRPEAIKMAPVIQALRRRPEQFTVTACSTGQHREMLDQVLPLFELRPDVDLAVMTANQTLASLTAELLKRLDATVLEHRPDWILAQGDTTTVAAAAMVAFYRRIRFGHIEAGLRTHDFENPFPEEYNRRIADLSAAGCFAPTPRAAHALLSEGIPRSRILASGNTVIDALQWVAGLPFQPGAESPLSGVDFSRRTILLTAHRRESFGETFREMCLAVRTIAERWAPEGVQILYPVHLNPNVQQPVREILSGLDNLLLLPPLDYQSLVHVMRHSELVLTDSGGIQEEAPSLGVPVVVMRRTTERPEGVEAGVVELVGTDGAAIVSAAERYLADPRRGSGPSPYGDGLAGERIASWLADENPADFQTW
jgi:UDP-N-acetylglucosamine 2-epimerase